jgi:hypothetical protein
MKEYAPHSLSVQERFDMVFRGEAKYVDQDGKYADVSKSKLTDEGGKVMLRKGTVQQVGDERAYRTKGGLYKRDLVRRSSGTGWVSKKKSEAGKRQMAKLVAQGKMKPFTKKMM